MNNLKNLPMGTHPFFYHPFISYFTPIVSGKVILDLGSGRGLMSCLLHGSRDLKDATLIGLEINDEYIKACQEHNSYHKIIKHPLPKIPLEDKSVDLVFCIEVIEHLKKSEGLKLLQEIDRVCRGRVIISTPNIFFQPLEGRETEDKHLSLWSVKDFRSFGYKVYGMGFKIPMSYKKYDPLIRLKQALYYFFTPISFILPEISGGLLAVKDY